MSKHPAESYVNAYGAATPASSSSSERALQTTVILVGPQETLRRAAQGLAAALEQSGRPYASIELPKDRRDAAAFDAAAARLRSAQPACIAACGPEATQFALDRIEATPILFLLVPNAADSSFVSEDAKERRPIAGIPADVAPTDQVAWIKAVHPASKRLAVLHSHRTRKTVDALRLAAEREGLTLTSIPAAAAEFPKALAALDARPGDGVVMIPDAAVYNGPNMEQLLLWGIRNKTPVWAFSARIVEAGALGGLYVDPEAAGRQAADLVERLTNSAPTARIGLIWPRDVRRAINDHTAELIGIVPKSLDALAPIEHVGGKP